MFDYLRLGLRWQICHRSCSWVTGDHDRALYAGSQWFLLILHVGRQILGKVKKVMRAARNFLIKFFLAKHRVLSRNIFVHSMLFWCCWQHFHFQNWIAKDGECSIYRKKLLIFWWIWSVYMHVHICMCAWKLHFPASCSECSTCLFCSVESFLVPLVLSLFYKEICSP